MQICVVQKKSSGFSTPFVFYEKIKRRITPNNQIEIQRKRQKEPTYFRFRIDQLKIEMHAPICFEEEAENITRLKPLSRDKKTFSTMKHLLLSKVGWDESINDEYDLQIESEYGRNIYFKVEADNTRGGFIFKKSCFLETTLDELYSLENVVSPISVNIVSK